MDGGFIRSLHSMNSNGQIMDDADRTVERTELGEALRRRHQLKPGPEVESNGHCANCGEPATKATRFCDVSCREDWQLRQSAQRRNGALR